MRAVIVIYEIERNIPSLCIWLNYLLTLIYLLFINTNLMEGLFINTILGLSIYYKYHIVLTISFFIFDKFRSTHMIV